MLVQVSATNIDSWTARYLRQPLNDAGSGWGSDECGGWQSDAAGSRQPVERRGRRLAERRRAVGGHGTSRVRQPEPTPQRNSTPWASGSSPE